jgi:hypothetical protein
MAASTIFVICKKKFYWASQDLIQELNTKRNRNQKKKSEFIYEKPFIEIY